MPVEPLDKAKALLKFGAQAMHGMRLEEAEKCFREAGEIALVAKHERMQARALARSFYALAYQGRMEEARQPTLDAMDRLVKHGNDEVAGLIVKSCFMRFVPADNPSLAEMVKMFVAEAAPYPQDPDVARALGQVALICNAIKERGLAAQLLERALPVMEAALGAAHPEVGLMIANLADLRCTLDGYKNLAKFEPPFRRAIAIQAAALAPNHPERVAPLATTGRILAHTGRYDEARGLLEQALSIAIAVEGAEGQTPQMVRVSLTELETLLEEKEAEPYLLKAVEAAAKDPAAAPLDVALKLTALCRHYFVRGKAKTADPHYRKLRAISDTLGEWDQGRLRSAMGATLGIYAMLQQGRADAAEALLLGELEAMERILPRGHGDILGHVYFTGNVYRMMERHKDALRQFERYTATERERAEADPARADGLTRLLDAQLELGRKKDAERTAGEIERLTGAPPVLDAALNEFARQLQSVWHMLKLEKFPDLIGAALKGDPGAGLVVGLCHAAGQGRPRSLEKARPWFEAAARAGHPVAVKIVDALQSVDDLPFDFQLIANVAADWAEQTARK